MVMVFRRCSFLVIATLLIFLTSPASAVDRRVPQDYSTIQAAVNAASEGERIVVEIGTYYENVNVDKGITITSTDPKILFEGKHVHERPSRSGRAPIPPAPMRICENLLPSWPIPEKSPLRFGAPPLSAMTLSGMTLQRAPYITELRKCPVRWRALTAAGKRGFTTVPEGATTFMGR